MHVQKNLKYAKKIPPFLSVLSIFLSMAVLLFYIYSALETYNNPLQIDVR